MKERAILVGLMGLVDENEERVDSEGTLRHGEVAIYHTSTGYSVQVRRRNGSAVECGRHTSLYAALVAATGGTDGT